MEFDKQSIPGSYNVCRQTAEYSVQVVIVWAIKFTFGYSFFIWLPDNFGVYKWCLIIAISIITSLI